MLLRLPLAMVRRRNLVLLMPLMLIVQHDDFQCHRGNRLCEMSVRILTRRRAPAGCDAANRQEFASMGDEGALEKSI